MICFQFFLHFSLQLKLPSILKIPLLEIIYFIQRNFNIEFILSFQLNDYFFYSFLKISLFLKIIQLK